MSDQKAPARRRGSLPYAIVCFLLAGCLFAVALGVPSGGEGDPSTPGWVVALCGLVFVVGGLMLAVGTDSWLNDALAAVICLGFAGVGTWAALFGDAGKISGGLPFLSAGQNAVLGRVMFALGSLMCVGLAAYAVMRASRRARGDEARAGNGAEDYR